MGLNSLILIYIFLKSDHVRGASPVGNPSSATGTTLTTKIK